MEIEGRHALPEFLRRDFSISIRIEESESPSHVETLEVEGSSYFIPDFEKTALPEVCSFESSAEILDDNLTTLLWICDTPEKAVVLNGKREIELRNTLFEILHRDEVGLRI
jgi:hypothetical protein